MERGCERYKREGPTETVAGRARIAKPRGISVILIGKYNDHRVERERVVSRQDREGGDGERANGWSEGGFRWRSLRTQVAAHLLRADSNCFPYLRVPLRHCNPPVWLAALPGRVAMYT